MSKKKRRKIYFSLFDSLAKIAIVSLCCLFIMINIISMVSAQGVNDAFMVTDGSGQDTLDTVAGKAGYDITAEDKNQPFDFISPVFTKVINSLLSFLGIAFILLMIYGGFLWMSDQGNEEQVKKAKGLIVAAIIGVGIVLSSYAISFLVVNTFGDKTLEQPSSDPME